MEDYQANSNKDKDKEKKEVVKERKVVKVVTGEVVQKPRGIGYKFKEVFFGGDFKNALRFVAGDVLLPAFRNLLVDSITKGTERVVYGESYRSRQYTPDMRSRIQYNNPLARPADPRTVPRLPDQAPRSYRASRREIDNILLRSREDADLVIERMIDIVDKYEVVSLAELNELLGLPTSHIDQKWGWTSVNNFSIRQVRDGYLLELPPPEEI